MSSKSIVKKTKNAGSSWRDKMFKTVVEVVNIFRKKTRSRKLEDGFYEKRSFFQHVQFFKGLESDSVKVCVDSEKKKVTIKGQGDDFFKACDKCDGLLKMMVENKKKRLKDKRMWDILSQKMELVEKRLKSDCIEAKIELEKSGDSVLITAMNDLEFTRAGKALDDLIIIKTVPIPKNADIVPEGAEFENFKAEQEKSRVLKMYMETTSDRKCKEVSLIGAKEDVIQAQKQTEEFVTSKIPKPKPPPTNPQKNRSQIDNPVCSRGAGKPGDGTVTVLLRKGDITTFKGDAIINLLPDNLKLGNGGAVCNSILRVGGEMIQQEINKACQLIQHTPGIRFITSAGSSRNVKKIIHFVLSNLDTMGLQNDIKECFFLAQRYSLRSILIPAIGTANFNLSSRASAEIIFNAMSNFSTACTYHLTVIVVVFQEKMLPDFKSVLNESVEKCFSLKPEESNAVKLPTNWTVQAKDIVVQLVKLQQTSSEYIKILSLFRKSDVSGWVVTMIERIQNPGLYRAYIAKKQSMCTRNELKLFHGTDSKNIAAINTQNFSRGFAGENATRYGNGVYFARDSSYSVNYCKSEVGRNLKLYVVKVLVGEYTLGREGMKAPPLRGDRKNPGLQFDSLVNNMTDPSIFVIFQDHQCYPEYLISFKKKVK